MVFVVVVGVVLVAVAVALRSVGEGSYDGECMDAIAGHGTLLSGGVSFDFRVGV